MIDFENVQPQSLASLEKGNYEVRVFVGATQPKLPFELVEAMQRLGSRAEYVRIAGNGPNALDFHIAYYIGKLSSADPTAHFVIVSKDTGFDPLIKHLVSLGITVSRSKTVPGAPKAKLVANPVAKPAAKPTAKAAPKPAAKPAPAPAKKQKQPVAPAAKAPAKAKPAKAKKPMTPDARAREFMALMQPANSPRPRSEKSLSSALCSHFRLGDQEAAAVVASMHKSGFIKMSEGQLLYAIAPA